MEKKKKKKKLLIIICGILVIGIITLVIILLTSKKESLTLKVELSKYSILIGESVNVTVTPSKTIKDPEYIYEVSDPLIASITSTGVLTSSSKGEVKEKVKTIVKSKEISGLSDTLNILVTHRVLVPNGGNLAVGDSMNATISYIPDDGTTSQITYTSSDTSILTVDQTGKIDGIAEGVAHITATNQYGIIANSIDINVYITSTWIDLNISIPVAIGTSDKIVVTCTPANATYQEFTFSSSDPSIFTIVDDRIVATKVGSAYLTAVSKSGLGPSVQMFIYTYQPVTSIELNFPEKVKISIFPFSIPLVYYPASAGYADFRYSSSNPEVLTIDQGGSISAISEGTATITATNIKNESIFATSNPITVYTGLSGFTLSYPKNVAIGGNAKLAVTLDPANATYKDITFLSNDGEVLSVDSSGNLLGLTKGITSITVRSVEEPNVFQTTMDIHVDDGEYLKALEYVEDHYNFNIIIPTMYALSYTDPSADADGFTPKVLEELNKLIERDTSLLYTIDTLEAMKTTIKNSLSLGLIYSYSRVSYEEFIASEYITPETLVSYEGDILHTYVIKTEIGTVTDILSDIKATESTKYVVVYLKDGYFKTLVELNNKPIITGDDFSTFMINFLNTSPSGKEVKSITRSDREEYWVKPANIYEKNVTLHYITRILEDDTIESFIVEFAYNYLEGYKVNGVWDNLVDCPYDFIPLVTEIDASVGLSTLHIGGEDTTTITVVITPIDSEFQGVTYLNFNPDVVSVDSSGLVTALKIGTAMIQVRSEYNIIFTDLVTITVVGS